MARVSLKNIVGKKNEINSAVLALMDQLKEVTWIEDENENCCWVIQLKLRDPPFQ